VLKGNKLMDSSTPGVRTKSATIQKEFVYTGLIGCVISRSQLIVMFVTFEVIAFVGFPSSPIPILAGVAHKA